MDRDTKRYQLNSDGSLLMNFCTSENEIDSTATCGKENCSQKQKKRKATHTAESPIKKFSIQYGSDVYMEEFAKYLRKFQNPKERKQILDILRKKGIHEELRIENMNLKYDVNKELVEFIMTQDKKCIKHFEFNWKTIEDSIIKVERKIMDENLEIENREQRKICSSG